MLKVKEHRRRPQELLKMLKLILTSAVLGCCLSAAAQPGQVENPSVAQVQKLEEAKRWQEIVNLLGPLQARSADMDLYFGTALARLGRKRSAENAFEAGQRLAPRDARFPVELAGIAFEGRQYPEAARLLRRAIKLDPHDAYANDFLGTIYYLEDHIEASLKYWNRAGKPMIAQILEDPQPEVSPALLDEAFVFSPASMLRLPQLLDSRARIDGLGIFPQYHFDLRARNDGTFDLVFRNQERDGFGQTKLEALFLLLRGLPFSSVNPEYDNLNHEAMNFVSMYRWDAQKRRVYAKFSAPFEHGAKYRYDVATDLRNEQWAIVRSFTGPAPVLASLNLRREVLGFDLASHASARWFWLGGAEVSHRDFRSIVAGTVLTPALLAKGYQLKQTAELGATLWRVPERRFVMDADVLSQAARLWSRSPEAFEKLQGSLGWHWLPRATGDDYAMQHELRAGGTFGQEPFDELFELGLERDNDLPMRAHVGTHDGRKGSAPLGRDYFVSNWEEDKNVYENGIVAVKLGPFVDTGQISDPSSALGSHKWLCDLGVQAKLRVFGRGVVFSYGKDLRSGNNAFYVDVLKKSDDLR